MKYTLDSLIAEKFDIFNYSANIRKEGLPGIVKSRAVTGLMLLTQVTKPEQNLTGTIVKLANILNPALSNLGYVLTPKFEHVKNIESDLHNRKYDKKEYASRIVMVIPVLEYIQTWYFESDEETPFDLTEYSNTLAILKQEAEKQFQNSIWSKK